MTYDPPSNDYQPPSGVGFALGMLSGGALVGMFLTFVPTSADDVRRQAVKAGAAYYVVDEDGDPQFTWKYVPQFPCINLEQP